MKWFYTPNIHKLSKISKQKKKKKKKSKTQTTEHTTPEIRKYEDSISPAPGFRDSGYNKGYGVLWYIGYQGFCWSSTVSDSHVHFLDFNPGWLTPQNNYHRAYGFPLRCLQE